jgi:hypothetical protein
VFDIKHTLPVAARVRRIVRLFNVQNSTAAQQANSHHNTNSADVPLVSCPPPATAVVGADLGGRASSTVW